MAEPNAAQPMAEKGAAGAPGAQPGQTPAQPQAAKPAAAQSQMTKSPATRPQATRSSAARSPAAKPAASAAGSKASSGQTKARSDGNGSAAKARPATAAKPAPSGAAQGPIELLKADHRKVEALFDQFETADDRQKDQLCRQICAELVIHTMIEEEIFYPECRRRAAQDEETEEKLDEAQVEHDSAKLMIADLFEGRPDPLRDAKVQVLGEQIRHHVQEEEKPREGILAKALEAGLDTPDLARRLQQRKQQLQAEMQAGRLRPPPPKSIKPPSRSQGRPYQEESMPRERDEYGRFMSDDDRDYGRSYGERGGGRGRYQDDDRSYRSEGRGQGGWFGDPEGHSRASREGWDERRDEGRSYRSRGRDDDDDDRRSGRGQGGWFGDPEGHARASREGWDERRGESRSRDYDERRGESRSYGRGRDDDDRGSSRDRGQGGWFGDPEGHARAAREGWDERRDDDRTYRSRSRDDDDDDRRGGRGHGGWYGDPQGHSRASREGWDRR